MADSGSPTANDVRAIADELEDAPYRDHHSPDAWTEWSRELAAWQHATPSKRGPRDKRAKYRIRAGVPNSLRPKVCAQAPFARTVSLSTAVPLPTVAPPQ
jgi:hypothetical protein